MDSSIRKALTELREDPNFANAGGYQKLAQYLRRYFGYYVNKKKVYRLCKEENLLLPRNKKKVTRRHKRSQNRQITAPNQLWQFDIKYGYIPGENRHFYLLAFIDVFDRDVIGYHIGLSCKAKDLINTFKSALLSRELSSDTGPIIGSDNGPQMTSNMFRDYVETSGIEHEFIPPKDSNKNAFVESFFSIVETEFFQTRYFRSYSEAHEATVDWIDFYRTQRIHGSLNMMTPIDFQARHESGDDSLGIESNV